MKNAPVLVNAGRLAREHIFVTGDQKRASACRSWGSARPRSTFRPPHSEQTSPLPLGHAQLVRPAELIVAPIEDGGFGAVSSSHFGGIGLDLMAAFPGLHD